ncbi:hypothetical protein FRC02_009277 [Tulasnella sp. 418]|nr:hypothetical protein FRC02_009277 [Tulasnella sp. 418]
MLIFPISRGDKPPLSVPLHIHLAPSAAPSNQLYLYLYDLEGLLLSNIFGSFKTKSSTVAVQTTTKSASEKLYVPFPLLSTSMNVSISLLLSELDSLKIASKLPLRALPTLYPPCTIHIILVPSLPPPDRAVPPHLEGFLSLNFKLLRRNLFSDALLDSPAKSTTSNVPRRRPALRHSNSLTASQAAAIKFYADFLAAQKRATVRLCAKMDNDPDARNNVFRKVKNDV